MLAAVLLKMETYGFIRFSLPLFPDASVYFTGFMAVLGLVAIIYTAMIAYAQEDMKQMIAYSSISHMGVIILGVFALNVEGIAGSVYLMIGHGIVSGALFMCVGVLYDRRKTKMIKEFGGLAHNMPMFALVYGIVLMASVGLPLTIGFIGEFLSLLGFYKYSPILTFMGSLTIVLGVVYMLSMYKRTFFGKLTKPENKSLKDIFGRELFALGSLVIVIIVLGIYPKIMLAPLNPTLNQLINVMEIKAVNEESKIRLKISNSIGENK
jgi:NADH-quinone oxidoreductase subunit M